MQNSGPELSKTYNPLKVLILGGYGVFGGRLARLLMRDNHQVWVAGRSLQKATDFTKQYGGTPAQIDITKDLNQILVIKPDVVVDAVGPFQNYGQNALSLPTFCIENKINYLDLSDDADFTININKLNQQAIEAGTFALSGVSSVPTLSSSVIAELSKDLDQIETIEVAIMPGNCGPRGKSVVTAIVSQMGNRIKLWRGNQWREMNIWSDTKSYHLLDGITRKARLVSVPDIKLFPEFFKARSVTFRAGLELSIMDWGMSILSWLRRRGLFRNNTWVISVIHFLSILLLPFGSDTGYMTIIVKGKRNEEMLSRQWILRVGSGEGFFIPTVAIHTLLRSSETITPGARACLSELSLSSLLNAMSDLDTKTETRETHTAPLFQSILQDEWNKLTSATKETHLNYDIESYSGTANVERGKGILPTIVAGIFGFPKEGQNIPVTVTKTKTDTGETWQRNFNGNKFKSHLSASKRKYHSIERFGPFSFELYHPVKEDALHYEIKQGWFLNIPLPTFMLPGTDAIEYEKNGTFNFDIKLTGPMGVGKIVRYRGTLNSSRNNVRPTEL